MELIATTREKKAWARPPIGMSFQVTTTNNSKILMINNKILMINNNDIDNIKNFSIVTMSSFGSNSCSDNNSSKNNDADNEFNENSNISMCMLSGSC